MSMHRFKIALTRLSFGFAITVFQSCIFQTKDDRVAGGAEDFPNTVALGKAASGHISEHPEWNQFSIIPSAYPSFAEAESLVVNPDPIALGKSSIANIADSVIWDYSDSATLGIVRRIHLQESITRVHRDTSVFLFVGKSNDSNAALGIRLEARGVDSLKISGRVQTYRYENLDSTGGFDRGTFNESSRESLLGTVKLRSLILLPGPDGDLRNTSDNRPAYFAFARTLPIIGASSDTLEAFQFKDADGDGTLWGDGDSGIVDFQQKNFNLKSRPTIKLTIQKIRLVLFKKELKPYPIRFQENRIEMDGKEVAFSITGTRTDSLFNPGDTAWISVHVAYPTAANQVEKHSRYRIKLGSKTFQNSDRQLLGYTTATTWKNNSLLSTHFKLVPDLPVFANELSITGDIELGASFTNGDEVKGQGRYADSHFNIELILTSKEGIEKKFHTQWDAHGNLLSQIRLK
jgi:hypothetical protein